MAAIEVHSADEFDREVLRSKESTVALFWAAWCPFCRAFKPIFDDAVRKHDARFALVRLDEYDNPLWDTYRVNVVPSLAFFRGGELVARKDGRLMRGLSQEELSTFLDEVLPAAHAD